MHVTGAAGAEIDLAELPAAPLDAAATGRSSRRAYSAGQRGFVPFTLYDRHLLRPGMAFDGPCLVEEESATTVVDVGSRVSVDRYGSLDIILDATE